MFELVITKVKEVSAFFVIKLTEFEGILIKVLKVVWFGKLN